MKVKMPGDISGPSCLFCRELRAVKIQRLRVEWDGGFRARCATGAAWLAPAGLLLRGLALGILGADIYLDEVSL